MTVEATGVRGYTNLGTFFSGAGRYHARSAIFRKPAHVLRFRLLMEFPRHLNSFNQIIGLEPAKSYGWTIRRWESSSNKDALGLLAGIHVAPCLRSSELVPDAKDHPILLQRVGAGVGTHSAKL